MRATRSVDAALERLVARLGPTNAFAQVFADEARADAELERERLRELAGRVRG